jgi:hypothetical protein
MEKDKFDLKMIDIEAKSFEVNMQISGFAYEILAEFSDHKIWIEVELPYFDSARGYINVNTRSVYYNKDDGLIYIEAEELQNPASWDDFNIAAKEIIINELHHKYKAEKLFKSLSGKDELH